MDKMTDSEKYGTRQFNAETIKTFYMCLKLLSDEGLKIKEFQEEIGCCYRTVHRLLASCREALYLAYGDDVKIIYSRKDNRYRIIYLKSKFNLRNIPFLNI